MKHKFLKKISISFSFFFFFHVEWLYKVPNSISIFHLFLWQRMSLLVSLRRGTEVTLFSFMLFIMCSSARLLQSSWIWVSFCLPFGGSLRQPCAAFAPRCMALVVKNLHANAGDSGSIPGIPWSRKKQPTPVFLPGKFQEQRSLAGYSPWGCKESDMIEWLSTTHVYFTQDEY